MADTQEQAEGKNRQTVYDAHGNVVGTTDAGRDREGAAGCRMDFSPSSTRPQSLGQTGNVTG